MTLHQLVLAVLLWPWRREKLKGVFGQGSFRNNELLAKCMTSAIVRVKITMQVKCGAEWWENRTYKGASVLAVQNVTKGEHIRQMYLSCWLERRQLSTISTQCLYLESYWLHLQVSSVPFIVFPFAFLQMGSNTMKAFSKQWRELTDSNSSLYFVFARAPKRGI